MNTKNEFKDIAKKIVYTGIGAVAVAAEAAGGVVEKLAEKGEQLATDSKIINDGKKAVKDFKENVNKSQAKRAMDAVADMTKEEREALRKKLDEVESMIKEAAENISEAISSENKDSCSDSTDGETQDDDIEVEIFYDVNPDEKSNDGHASADDEHKEQ